MDNQVREILKLKSQEIQNLYDILRQTVYDSTKVEIVETLWARLPSYYAGEKFVRLIPFLDHINIEASAIINHKDELSGYKITPKGMLQIFLGQQIPTDILRKIFKETLS